MEIFFSFFNTVVIAVRECAKIEQENINNVLILKENFKIGRFDNTIVGQEDIINCIMEYKQKVPDVIVDNRISSDSSTAIFNINLNINFKWNLLNDYYLWDGSRLATGIYPDYNYEDLIAYIPNSAKYRARVVKNESGDVVHFWFSRIS